ncbi:MAG: hypothetical protein CL526_12310 [Aequorivita sp.]|nr:hypothetical protein [Aequorivita sp.]|tara:strand:- start:66545 stop:67747 length:1203 start_codon:yes stop_codon:yes gene_type:complete
MNKSIANHNKLLNDATRIIKHQEEIAILKGETFNIFSILNMESRENATHSAFLGELLNPKGSHRLGSVFLKCFLKQLDVEDHLNIETSRIVLEKSIGVRNDKSALGGRVDIYIEDSRGKSICIENKIYAGDQNLQIARYCNYNVGKNLVYYLTLNGNEPSNFSQGEKEAEKDFFTLSYRDEIIEWLEQCQKEATQLPILRETINQYAILIRKLTNQLSDDIMEKDIKDLIAANYQAATVIGSNIWSVELEYCKKFISEIVNMIRISVSDDFIVEVDSNLTKAHSGLSIRNKLWPKGIVVRLEGNSKIPWNTSYYGVRASKTILNRDDIKNAMQLNSFDRTGFGETDGWPCYRIILDLSNSHKRARLFNSSERMELVKEIGDYLIELANLCEAPFAKLDLN